MKTILVAGTHADTNGDPAAPKPWWHPQSTFGVQARAEGVSLPERPFRWSTALDGVWGENRDWERWGTALTWFAHTVSRNRPVNIIAHSHGGQVAAYSAAMGLRINVLITVATPVRRDMEVVWIPGRQNIARWIHLRSDDSDWWQWFGSFFDGSFGNRREMPLADMNVFEPDVGHSGLLRPDLWERRGWFRYVKDTERVKVVPGKRRVA